MSREWRVSRVWRRCSRAVIWSVGDCFGGGGGGFLNVGFGFVMRSLATSS